MSPKSWRSCDRSPDSPLLIDPTMPLPKPPGKPATLLDISTAVEARAARPGGQRQTGAATPASHEVVSMRPARGAPAHPATVAPIAAAEAAAEPAAGGAEAPARTPPARSAATARRGPRRQAAPIPKLFVLDTNVLMHDPSSLFRFAEHDVFLPMMTLEELDNHKKGMSEVSRNARQVSRSLDALIAAGGELEQGIALSALGNRDAQGRLFFQTQAVAPMLPSSLPMGKADNQILGVVRAMQDQLPDRQVVLVSKDINMRIKAHTMGLPAEDYFNDQVLEDTDL